MKEKIECVKCGWVGGYGDLIAPTSDHEPSCPKCLGDDFVDCQHDIETLSDGYDDNPYYFCRKCKQTGLFEDFQSNAVGGNVAGGEQAKQFEKELFALLSKYNSLKKSDCIYKLKYVLKNVEIS